MMKNETILQTIKAGEFEKKYPGAIDRYIEKTYRHTQNTQRRVYGVAVSGNDETDEGDLNVNLLFHDGTMVAVGTVKDLKG